MQSYSLTVDKFLDHAAKWHQDRELVEADAGREVGRTTYRHLHARSNRLSGALASLGLVPGDRVGTLAWNTLHHVEVYYAVMGAGLVCHTLNPRLTAHQLAGMVNEAGNRALAVAVDLLPLAAKLVPLCPTLQHIIVLDGPPVAASGLRVPVLEYEALLAAHGAAAVWGAFPEETPAGLCYTSGTTGSPKGVLYTHRSNYLHTLRALQADAVALTGRDVVLLAVPMFHANGWGLPFAAAAVGAKLVLPGRHTDGASLAGLMRDEGVTVAVGVQTVWLGLVDHLDAAGGALPSLERVIIGGSSCPDTLIRRFEERLEAKVQTSWGMTELSPVGTILSRDAGPGETSASGHPPMGLDLKLTDADGATLAEQRGPVGHLWVKGASVLDRYFQADTDAIDAEGFFATGDLAVIDAAGNLTISGRAKDLIKSGGEWINPGDIELIIGRDPAVGLVAVIARADAKWGERPVIVVEPRQGRVVDRTALLHSLRGGVADWWIPNEVVVVAAMPVAASGKIDKNRLRLDYERGDLGAELAGA